MVATHDAASTAVYRPRTLRRSFRVAHLIVLLTAVALMCSGAAGKEPVTRHGKTREVLMPPAKHGAFATIFYDYGADSDDMLLAIRVLMRSIRESKSIYRRIVIVPADGLLPANKAQLLADDPELELVRSDLPNVFKQNRVTDPRAQLLHMRNKLVLWDDPTLSKLQRVVYLDPENLVLSNLDEIFACTQFCAVDNGQSVVYASSLLVISPESLAARNLYSDAIDAFMISGRSYNYDGISQGFLPGLFEAMEESPLFILEDGESQDDALEDGEKDSRELEDAAAFEREAAKSVVRRLPFFYSINHMVFYERLNWDLYKCKNKGTSNIPGPLLSFKYSGATIKPWNWVAYAYFQVNWHWQEMRDKLGEDHFGFFVGKFISLTVVFIMSWVCYVAMCLKLRNDPSGRMRRLSSWGFLPAPNNAEPLTMDILNSRVVRKACQFSCNVLYAVSSTPLFSSVVIVVVLMYTSVYAVPTTMHPHYAAILWAYLHDCMLLTVLIVYDVAHTLRTATWKKDEVPLTGTVFALAFLDSVKRLPAFLVVQYTLLRAIGRTDLFRNPVLRPTVLISLVGAVCAVQVRLLARAMRRVARK